MSEPFYNDKEKVVAFDCDDTLIMWGDTFYDPQPGRIPIVDPNDNKTMYLTPHKKHVHKVKGYFRAGYFVIIWSAGGGAWANAVARELGLHNFCHLITSKPQFVYDDLPLNEAIGTRKYYMPKGWKK